MNAETQNPTGVVSPIFAPEPSSTPTPETPTPEEVPCVAKDRGHRSCFCGGKYCQPRKEK